MIGCTTILLLFSYDLFFFFIFETHFLPNFLADCPTNYIKSSFEKVQLKGLLILPKMCVNFLAIFSLRFMTEKEGFHIFSSFFIILDQYILGRPLDLLDIASESGCYLFPTGGKKYPQRSHAQPILEKCYQVNHKHFLHLKISNSIFARRQAYTARTLTHSHTHHTRTYHTHVIVLMKMLFTAINSQYVSGLGGGAGVAVWV